MSASDKKRLRKEQAAANLTEKQLKEQKEAKNLKRHTLTFAVAMILVLAIAFGVLAAQGIDRTGIIQRNTNAVTIGKYTLTSAELNYYYIDTVNNFMSQLYDQYGNQAEMYSAMLYGLNYSSPLNTQMYTSTETWADYFAQSAVESAKNIYALYDAAIANNYTLTEEELANFEETITNTEKFATEYYGYSSLNGYLRDVFGYGANEENYRAYMMVSAIASKYYNAYAETLKYDDEDFREYEKEHYNEFSAFDYTSFNMKATDFLTGGEKDANGVINYTEEQNAAAVALCIKVAGELEKASISSKTELDAAIAKIDCYKDKTSAVSKQYTNTMYSNVNTKIASWLSDTSRKAGDYAVIADTSSKKDDNGNEIVTTNGYYLVIFEGRNDNDQKMVNVRHILEKFKGGMANEDGTISYSNEEKATALAAINTIKSKWLEDGKATEDSFAKYAKENSDDTGTASNGGLYEDIYPGKTVKTFNDWCFDESRKAGDYEVIESEYGYHLIYFVSHDELTYRDSMIKATLFNADMDKWYTEVTSVFTATNINTAHLDLDLIISAQ